MANDRKRPLRHKLIKPILATLTIYFAFIASAHAGIYLCANKNKQGNLAANTLKVTVSAKSLKKAIPKARQVMKNKGYKVKKVGCTPTQAKKTKAQSGKNYLCGNLNRSGKIGANSIKIPVKANTWKKAIVKAKQAYSKKGYKIKTMGCAAM